MKTLYLHKKDQIISAARYLFVLKGYKGTSIREIATQANVQISLIYHYFENKFSLWNQIRGSLIQSTNNTHLIEYILDAQELDVFISNIVNIRFEFFKNNYEALRMFDWNRLEDQGEKLLCIPSKKTHNIYLRLEKKIKIFQDNAQITDQFPPRHILLIISSGIIAPFLKTGQSELKSDHEENLYKESLIKFIMYAIKA